MRATSLVGIGAQLVSAEPQWFEVRQALRSALNPHRCVFNPKATNSVQKERFVE